MGLILRGENIWQMGDYKSSCWNFEATVSDIPQSNAKSDESLPDCRHPLRHHQLALRCWWVYQVIIQDFEKGSLIGCCKKINCWFRPQCSTCAFGWAKLGFIMSFLQIYRHITHEVERIDIYETHQSTNFVQRQGIFGGSGGTGMTAQVSTIKFLQLKLASTYWADHKISLQNWVDIA